MQRVVPIRKFVFGAKPGVKGKEATEPGDRSDENSLWVFRRRDPTEEEKMKLIGASLEISIAASFNLHIYTFGGQCYKQLRGGSIGSRLTMAVSKVIMLVWGRRVKAALRRAGVLWG